MKPSSKAIMAGVVLAAAVTACSSNSNSSGSSGHQTVVFWEFNTDQPSINAYKHAIAEFEKLNPTITVDMQVVPWTEQEQKITTALVSGGLPDVSFLGNDVVAQYAHDGALAPLDSYMAGWSKQEGHNITADYWPGDPYYYHLNGHWYGAPMADETSMVFYRADLFRKAGLNPDVPPTTWPQLLADAQKLKKVTAIPWSITESKDYNTIQTLISVWLADGAHMLTSQGQCGFETPQYKEALTYYTSISKQGLAPTDAVNLGETQEDDLFTSGKAGILIDGPWIYTTIQQQNPKLLPDVRMALIPGGSAGEYGFLGGWPLVMWQTSTHKAAAAKWIEYATSPKGAMNAIDSVSGFLPGRVSLMTQAPWTSTPWTQFAQQMKSAYPYQYPAPEIPQMGKIEVETVQDSVQRVASGAQSVDQSTAQLCQTMNAELAK